MDFNDSNWSNAYIIELNGGGDGIRDYMPDFPDEAAWLWTADDFGQASGLDPGIDSDINRTIYCRSPVLGRWTCRQATP